MFPPSKEQLGQINLTSLEAAIISCCFFSACCTTSCFISSFLLSIMYCARIHFWNSMHKPNPALPCFYLSLNSLCCMKPNKKKHHNKRVNTFLQEILSPLTSVFICVSRCFRNTQSFSLCVTTRISVVFISVSYNKIMFNYVISTISFLPSLPSSSIFWSHMYASNQACHV